jgi:addiction module HigA family antidote
MMLTKRRPVCVGEMLIKEFMEPLAVTQEQLAKAMDVSRRTINEICNN